MLKLIGEFDEKGGWHGVGINSCAHWLNWKCGISLGPAREKVRVARALPALPKISTAFRAGKVSYSKVRAMTRVATEKNEEALLQVALGGSAANGPLCPVRLSSREFTVIAYDPDFGLVEHAPDKRVVGFNPFGQFFQ